MPIKVACEGCGASFKAPDAAAGKRTACPKCGGAIAIPGTRVEAVAPQPPPPVQMPTPPPAAEATPQREPARVEVGHRVEHRAKGSFGSAFKGTMGCLLAIGIVSMVGCLVTAGLLFTGAAATVGVADQVMKDVDKAFAEQQAQREVERAEREGQLAAWQSEVDQVVDLLTVTDAAVSEAGQFEVAKNRLAFTVENGSDFPISRVYFSATIEVPGRSIPVATGEANYSIPGGIEPGESKTLELIPNAFNSELGTNKAPEGATLSVDITDADWPGKPEKPLVY